ncbi:MAG: biopolymer transporter ExbD [Calditrichaeota bacterium]|nr:biopolymer transporter ExbD [Calditrichota bacterium]
MKFNKKSKAEAGIPTASMPDIIFMLLIFFMVTTVFKEFRGIPVRLPAARKIEKLPGKRNVAYIYADDRDRVSIDDKFVEIREISRLMYDKMRDEIAPLRVVSMKIDERANMGFVTKIQEELRKAGGTALNVNYSTKTASK